MAKATVSVNRKRKPGRPRVDAVLVGVRIPPDLLAKLDEFIAGRKKGRWKMGRPEAIRVVLAYALPELEEVFEQEKAAAENRKR